MTISELSIEGAGITTVKGTFNFRLGILVSCGPGGGTYFAKLTDTKYLKSLFSFDENCEDGIRRGGPNATNIDTIVGNMISNLAPGCGELEFFNEPRYLQTQITVKPKITIKQDGNDITGTTQNVTVGEKIVLDTQVENGPQISKQWEIAGVKNAGFQSTVALGGEMPLNASSLQNESVTFYWKDSGNNQVKYTTSIRGASNSVTATFNVIKPLVNVSFAKSTVHIGPDIFFNRDHLSYGDPTFNPNPGEYANGIYLVHSLQSENQVTEGVYRWVQIVNLWRRAELNNGTWQKKQRIGLDSSFPYSNLEHLVDSPQNVLNSDITKSQAKDSFSSWLMYKKDTPSSPNDNNSIYVPLAKVDWAWCGTASRIGKNWTLDSSSSSTPALFPTNVYPTWNALVTGANPPWTTDTSGVEIQCQ